MQLNVNSNNGVGSVCVLDGDGIQRPVYILGTSVKISALAGESVPQFTIHSSSSNPPRKVVNGVVAMAAQMEAYRWEGLLLSVKWMPEGKLVIGNSRISYSHLLSKRIGQVYCPKPGDTQSLPWLEVQLDEEERYTTCRERRGAATHFLPDGDLLCQYLVGGIDAETVREHAERFAQQESTEEVLRRQLEEARVDLERSEKSRTQLQGDVEHARSLARESQQTLERREQECEGLRASLTNKEEEASGLRRQLKEANDDRGRTASNFVGMKNDLKRLQERLAARWFLTADDREALKKAKKWET